ncbi:sigma-70 family RNA polymerase sigma factor [Clostridium botulinum]|uniref:sigma-70 family RNA polymerase sigma factor n=1 Tax=Clostridium TaxID=1485 RepID=UPI0005087D98|nr:MULTISPECIES: sigma-70 family RNA polymerase sigma factor [Clostridium]KFX54735.1 RNA polymerase subunit sigma-24 [Clostridium botulinum]MBN1072725.1 RNA polymerase subunit sigma-24 [Clostridium botulinum]MBY6780794.1 sigma-70 family RNA polymerase sigma factor [Clostridium botulinum]MBY6853967.1 sigma-70 family RNA polymerase sigma factor [Clostridium botulinum]NFR88303.1 sigma-70 family RNA polymerase sigma factor [Clostridium botulinum]
MPTELLNRIKSFQSSFNNFIEILNFFKSNISYLSYKLNYPEAYTDLIIYLYELLKKFNVNNFNNDIEVIRYIKKCLKHKSIQLHYKIDKDKKHIHYVSEETLLDALEKNVSNYNYSDIVFFDLISLVTLRQKEILFYRFYIQLSNIEIAKMLGISRQAVNKSLKIALKNLKYKLEGEMIANG